MYVILLIAYSAEYNMFFALDGISLSSFDLSSLCILSPRAHTHVHSFPLQHFEVSAYLVSSLHRPGFADILGSPDEIHWQAQAES